MEKFRILQDRPWFKFWPEGVPKTLEYPEIPLFGLLSRAAERWPENIAFSSGEERLSYEELDNLTGQLANGLHNLGVRAGDRVVLFLNNNLDFVTGYYGIMKAGATVVTVNPLSKAMELKHQLNDTTATAIITSKDFYPLVKEVKTGTALKTVILTGTKKDRDTIPLKQILKDYPSTPPRFRIKPGNDVAAIVYTGGTTGLSKGVLLTHYNLVANAIQNTAWFGWSPEDIIIGLLPFYHSWGGCTCLNSPVFSGARVIITPRFNADELLMTIEREKATVMYGAASMFISLINSPAISRHDLSSLRYVKSGAMPIPPEVKQRWEQLTGIPMVLGYGLSEASPEACNSPLQRIKPGTIGIPVIDTDARIVDEETGEIELPVGQTGELIIRGPQVMKGYLNRPEDTREALRKGWLYTGDLAMIDEEGYFHALDRKKETIKYKGYTIAPAEVEAILYKHPAVKECAVVGKPDALAGEIPKAYVVIKAEHTAKAAELITFCAERISPYKRIREVEFIDEIPKTPVGKLLRRVLRDRERDSQL
ncbi:MAG: long-chain fatty acid--CoA ligase [Dehalococcoidales bacterium]